MRSVSLTLSAVILLVAPGCGGSSTAGAPAAGAVVTAVAAGVLWASAGGCKLQGCPYGTYCDKKSGFCEVHKCSEGCPDGTVCNEGLDRCQAPGPGAVPSDRLPQDDKIRNPPLSH
jgi:hypothetical protein